MRRIKLIILVLTALSFAFATVGGALYYGVLKKYAIEQSDQQQIVRSQEIASHFDLKMEEISRSLATLASSLRYSGLPFLANQDKPDTPAPWLREIAQAMGASACFVMDQQGQAVASSAFARHPANLDATSPFWSFFQQAAKGQAGIYMGRGINSDRQSIYFSQPFKISTNVPYILICQMDIGRVLPSDLDSKVSINALLSPQGIIFASNRKELLFQSLLPVDQDSASSLNHSRQFGGPPLTWAGFSTSADNHDLQRGEESFHLHKVPLHTIPGWHYAILDNYERIEESQVSPLIRPYFVAIITLVAGAGVTIFFLYHQASRELSQRKTKEDELVRSQQETQHLAQTLEEILEALPMGVMVVGLDRRIKKLNRAGLQLIDRQRHEVEGKICHDMVCAAEKGSCPVLDLGRDVDKNERFITKASGELLPVLKTVVPVTLNGEKVLLEAFVDLRLQKEIERERRCHNTILTAISNSASLFLRLSAWQDNIQDMFRELGTTLDVSRIYLYRNQGLVTETMTSHLLHEWNNDQVPSLSDAGRQKFFFRGDDLAGWQQELSTGKIVYGVVAEFPLDIQMTLVEHQVLSLAILPVIVEDKWWGFLGFEQCSQSHLWVNSELHLLKTATEVVGAAISRQKIEQQLAAAHLYNESLIRAIPDIFLVLNVDGTIRAANSYACRALGRQEQDLLKKPIQHLIVPDAHLREQWFLTIEQICAAERAFECFFRGAGSTQISTLTSFDCVKNGAGDIVAFLCLAKDISKIKEVEARLDKQARLAHAARLTSLGEMATGIAHEINQPLTIIRLACQYLQKTLDQHGQSIGPQKSLHKIIDQVDRASNIILNMRAFARTNDENQVPIALQKPVNAALDFFKEQFRLHQIGLHTTLQPDVPMVLADHQKIQQIVVNLLSNARYAVEKKRETAGKDYAPNIFINLLYDQDNSQVCLEIIDNGIGMSPNEYQHCREPFYTTKQAGDGTGLGLHIVSQIVTECHGHITIESEKNMGSAFEICLPAQPIATQNPQKE